MNTITKTILLFEEELAKLEKQQQVLNARCYSLRQEIAKLRARFAVGDRVTYDGAKQVWKIVAIKAGYSNEPIYMGAAIKKDGTPSVCVVEIRPPVLIQLRLVSTPQDGER